MLNTTKMKTVVAGLLVAAACFGMAGCSAKPAAVIMGQEISEDAVTKYIEDFRANLKYTDEDSWKAYLTERGVTPEALRKTTIYELAAPVVIKAKADEYGLTVDEEAVQEEIDEMKASLLVETDEDWQEQLKSFGLTEEEYREKRGNKNLQEQVFAKIYEGLTPTDTDIENYMNSYLLGTSTKKIACVFGSGYKEMQKEKRTIESASSLAEGFKQAEKDADDKTICYRDLGWDVNCELTATMQESIAKLEKGQMNDVLLAESGLYYLFYVEDQYTFPSKSVKLSSVDKTLKESVSGLAKENLKSLAGSQWLQNETMENITINEMPSGLSYDVEVTIESSEEESADGDGAAKEDEGTSSDGKEEKDSK